MSTVEQPGFGDVCVLLLRSAKPDAPSAPTDEDLSLLACGWLPKDREAEVLQALALSAEARDRLLQLHAQLKSAQRSGSEQQRVLAAEPSLAAAIQQAIAGSVRAFADWNRACTEVFQGGSECPVVVHGLRDVWEAVQQKQARMYRVASTRSGHFDPNLLVRRARVNIFPGEEVADLAVQRTEDDVLLAHATFAAPCQRPREISLYVKEEEGGWVRLGRSLATGDDWSCSVPFVSRALDLPVGPLAAHNFVLFEGSWNGPKRTVLLKVSDTVASWTHDRTTRLLLKRPARIQNDRFSLTVILPPGIRDELRSARLDAAMALSPTLNVVLGAWLIDELPAAPEVELVCDMPVTGLPDCEFDYHAAIRLHVGRA